MYSTDSQQFHVDLSNFSGPLDVLLDLAKSQKVLPVWQFSICCATQSVFVIFTPQREDLYYKQISDKEKSRPKAAGGGRRNRTAVLSSSTERSFTRLELFFSSDRPLDQIVLFWPKQSKALKGHNTAFCLLAAVASRGVRFLSCHLHFKIVIRDYVVKRFY